MYKSNRSTPLETGRKRSRTRKTLVNAALRCYTRRSSDQVSINDIATEAGVTHATMYNYFRSRDEILEAICLRLTSDVVEQIKLVIGPITDSAERIATAIRLVLDISTRNPDWGWLFLRFLAAAPEFDEVANEVMAELRAGLAAGRIRYATESAALALLTGAIHMGMRPIIFGSAQENHVTEVARLVLIGLGLSADEALSVASRPIPLCPPVPDFRDR